MKRQLLCLGVLCLIAFSTVQAQADYFVKPSGDDGLDGTSWPNAFQTLQKALETATAGDEVWVAAGTYKPSAYPRGAIDASSDRNFSFHLVNGVAIYGGFDGTETVFSERDVNVNLTILSGDIGTESDNTDNVHHVVLTSGVDNTTILDGFTITAGNADVGASIEVDGFTYWSDSGAGMFNYNSSPVLTNLTISGNSGDFGYGVGMFNSSSSPEISNSTISNNTSSSGYGAGMVNTNASAPSLTNVFILDNTGALFGGGMTNLTSSPTLVNVVLAGNSVGVNGGAMENGDSSPNLINVTISGNSAGTNGGGIYNDNTSAPNLTNVTVVGNSASSGGGMYYNSSMNGSIYNSVFYGNGGEDIFLVEAHFTGGNNYTELDMTVLGINQLLSDPFINSGDPDGVDGTWATSDDGLVPALGEDLRNNGDDAQNSETNDITGQTRKIGAIDVGAYENQTPLSAQDIDIQPLHMYLYPNPVEVEGIINIRTNAALEVVEVYSLTGALIARQTTDLSHIDVGSLESGIYILKATSEHGEQNQLFIRK